jgi:hypothetical protein
MTVDVEHQWGALLVRDNSAHPERRYWFDVTKHDNIVLASVIIGEEHTRTYLPRDEWDVPKRVGKALDSEGHEHAYMPDGDKL